MIGESAPTLIFIIGPPAVGKMTVGHELSQLTDLKLLHNHHTIDLVLNFFPFGTPPFHQLVDEFRRRICEAVADNSASGLIFTYVWAFDREEDNAFVEEIANIFLGRNGRVLYVELEADLETRLARNESTFRLSQKPSKRDVTQSREWLLRDEQQYQMNSQDRFDSRTDYLRIDNTDMSAKAAAERIIKHFKLKTH